MRTRTAATPRRHAVSALDRASGDAATEVTFRGRGLALRTGSRLILLVCPL